jgi:hypothetical protein
VLYSKLVHSRPECAGIDTKQFRRAAWTMNLPFGHFKDFADMQKHRFVQIEGAAITPFSDRHCFAAALTGKHGVEFQLSSPMPDQFPFHKVLQFPDIAGPTIINKPFQRSGCNGRRDGYAQFPAFHLHKIACEGGDILFPLAKRRDDYREYMVDFIRFVVSAQILNQFYREIDYQPQSGSLESNNTNAERVQDGREPGEEVLCKIVGDL